MAVFELELEKEHETSKKNHANRTNMNNKKLKLNLDGNKKVGKKAKKQKKFLR